MAPLYNAGPVITDKDVEVLDDKVELQLSSDLAMRTLEVISDVVESFEAPPTRREKSSRKLLPRRIWGQFSRQVVVVFITFAGLAAAAALAVMESRRIINCEEDYKICQECEEPGTFPAVDVNCTAIAHVNGTTCEPQLERGDVTLTLERACVLDVISELHGHGMTWWRWILFPSLFWPLDILGRLLAKVIGAVVNFFFASAGGNTVFLTFGLHKQLGYVLRNGMWLGIWFAIAARPIDFANDAREWNRQSGADGPVWSEQFRDAHEVIWKILLCYVLYSLAGLLAAAAGKALSLQFHHDNHFQRIQKALVHEHIIQVLSQPVNLKARQNVKTSAGNTVELRGFGCAHFAALQYISRLLSDSDFNERAEAHDKQKAAEIREMAVSLQVRVAKLLSKKVAEAESAISSRPTVAEDGISPYPSGVPPAADSSFEPSGNTGQTKQGAGRQGPAGGSTPGSAQTWHQSSNRYPDTYVPVQNILQDDPFAEQSTSQLEGEDFRRNGAAAGLTSADDFLRAAQGGDEPSKPPQSNEASHWSRVRLNLDKSKTSFTAGRNITSATKSLKRDMDRKDPLPEEAAEAYTMLLETQEHTQMTPEHAKHLRRQKKENRDRINRANRLASEIASAKSETNMSLGTVTALQSYILGNSYIKIFSFDDDFAGHRSETNGLTNNIAARQLGYYLFWNLRAGTSGLAVTQADVHESAYTAGLKHAESAWLLLDRNADSEASLDEVVHAVEDVYDNRRTLAATLQDNQTVVAQVERLIWLVLIVLLVFAATAIFDVGTLASTWPALSAGLLSFSFVFSNSVRMVFENAVWLFFTHSFDVGDIIWYEDARYEVVKIKLQYIITKRVDGAHVIIPTNVMSTSRIHNVTRSDRQWGEVQLAVDIDTTPEQLERTATEIVANIKLNPKWYGGDYRIFLTGTNPGFKLELSVFFNHAGSGLDLITMNLARTHMIGAVSRGLQAAGVTYTLPPSQDGKGDTSLATALQRLQAVAPQSAAAAGADAASGDPNAQAGAAAANLLLFS